MKPRPSLLTALDAAVRVLRRHRRWIAAACAFLAVFTGLAALRPSPAPTVTVAAAARDLPGGTTLAGSDLLRLQLPLDAAPAGAETDPARLVGRVLNAPLSARSPVTAASVATGADLARPGFVVIAVPLPDALAGLLSVGATVDLIAAGKAGVVASGARVVSLPPPANVGAWTAAKRSLLVEIHPDAAASVAAAVDAGGLTIAPR